MQGARQRSMNASMPHSRGRCKRKAIFLAATIHSGQTRDARPHRHPPLLCRNHCSPSSISQAPCCVTAVSPAQHSNPSCLLLMPFCLSQVLFSHLLQSPYLAITQDRQTDARCGPTKTCLHGVCVPVFMRLFRD